MSKKSKIVYYKFPEPEVMSPNVSFHLINSSKPKEIQFTIKNRRSAADSHMEPEHLEKLRKRLNSNNIT